jgi:chromosome segregation ATPase
MSNNIDSPSIELIKKIHSINSQIKRMSAFIKYHRSEIDTLDSKLKNLNNKLKNLNNNIRNENSNSKKMYQLDKKQLEEDLKFANKNILVFESMFKSLIDTKYDLIDELYSSNKVGYQKYINLKNGPEKNKNYYKKLKNMNV